MIEDLLFYASVYVMLFISVFWLLVFFDNRYTRPRNKVSKFPPLSIIIPAHNEDAYLEKCVDSLAKQNYPKLRIIIVDDGSTDSTASIGKRLAAKYRFVKYLRKKKEGKAVALNAGLLRVRTEYFGFIDADTFLSGGALKNMIGYFRNDKTAAVISTIKPDKPRNIVERMQKIEYMMASFTRKLMSFIDSLYYTPGFALYKTSIVKNIGGFDEDNLTEDLEIGLRMKDAGYSIENTIEDCAHTVVPRNMRDLFDQRVRWYRGYIYNSRKYKHMFFSRKHGDLGIFILPAQYLLLALAVPLFFIGAYDFLRYAVNSAIDVRLVSYDFAYLLESANISIITPITFFVVSVLAAFILILKVSESEVKESISLLEYALYIAVYPFINLLLWMAAFVQEMLRTKKKW